MPIDTRTTGKGDDLPSPFDTSRDRIDLITQGAEAFLYKTTFLDSHTACALKYRPPKPYRHAILDKRLTRQRILAEARVLAKCRRDGVDVPGVLGLDVDQGWLATEWVAGRVVRVALHDTRAADTGIPQCTDTVAQTDILGLLARVGRAVGRLHATGVIHGDLTTSNMMLRPNPSPPTAEGADTDADAEPSRHVEQDSLQGQVVLIDFGLAQQSVHDEDRAVDLYVLERAFGSTHPELEHLFQHVLDAYAASYQGAKAIIRRLAVVRQRGRKKSMLG